VLLSRECCESRCVSSSKAPIDADEALSLDFKVECLRFSTQEARIVVGVVWC
jgi:hypothetical protein